jgi:hypothetical protein
MLLLVANPVRRAEVGVLVVRRARLVAAEAAVAAATERDRELRELAVGLAGAGPGAGPRGGDVDPQDRRLLAGGGRELERLRELAGGRPGQARAPLARVLRDLAAVHGQRPGHRGPIIEGDPGRRSPPARCPRC